jgi:hypothetical protein
MKTKAREHFAEGFRVLWANTKGLGKRFKDASKAASESFRNSKDNSEKKEEETDA